MRHIHLLSKTAFDDKNPQKLVQKALNQETEIKRISFLGMKPTAKVQTSEYNKNSPSNKFSFVDMFPTKQQSSQHKQQF